MKKEITLRSVILCVIAAVLAVGAMIYAQISKNQLENYSISNTEVINY